MSSGFFKLRNGQDLVSVADLVLNNSSSFTADGTFTVPANVYGLFISAVGGGGSGW